MFFRDPCRGVIKGQGRLLELVNQPSHQRGSCIRTITARAQLKKKKESLVVSVKGLDAKTN
jgi:hypothetical protein